MLAVNWESNSPLNGKSGHAKTLLGILVFSIPDLSSVIYFLFFPRILSELIYLYNVLRIKYDVNPAYALMFEILVINVFQFCANLFCVNVTYFYFYASLRFSMIVGCALMIMLFCDSEYL